MGENSRHLVTLVATAAESCLPSSLNCRLVAKTGFSSSWRHRNLIPGSLSNLILWGKIQGFQRYPTSAEFRLTKMLTSMTQVKKYIGCI
jgi:hypothetical protein